MQPFLKILTGAGVLLAILGVPMAISNQRVPKELGVENGRLAPMPSSPNAVSSQTDDPAKRVEPWPFLDSLEDTRNTLLTLLDEAPDADILQMDANYIHAVFTTRGFRFKDDLEFYLDEDAGLVHYRSASRVGYSDMGVNRSREEMLRKRYEELGNTR